VVAGHEHEGYVEAADYVLQVVEREISGGYHEVRAQPLQLVGIEPLIDLIGNRQDPGHGW